MRVFIIWFDDGSAEEIMLEVQIMESTFHLVKNTHTFIDQHFVEHINIDLQATSFNYLFYSLINNPNIGLNKHRITSLSFIQLRFTRLMLSFVL